MQLKVPNKISYIFFNAQKITKNFFIFLALISIIFSSCLTQAAPADDYGKYGLDKTVSKVDNISSQDITKKPSLPSLLGQFTGVMMSTIGLAFFVIMIYGGFSWMTARGNEAEVEKAKKMITSGFWGLVVILVAYAATYFRVSGDQSMRGIFWWDDKSYGE